METPKALEVIGDLKKIHREYKIYEKALEMVSVLANYETSLNDLERKVGFKQHELDSFSDKMKAVASEKESLLKEASLINENNKQLIKDANNKADSMLADALIKIEQANAEALTSIVLLKDESKAWEKQISDLKKEADQTKNQLVHYQKQMAEKRDELLKLFGPE